MEIVQNDCWSFEQQTANFNFEGLKQCPGFEELSGEFESAMSALGDSMGEVTSIVDKIKKHYEKAEKIEETRRKLKKRREPEKPEETQKRIQESQKRRESRISRAKNDRAFMKYCRENRERLVIKHPNIGPGNAVKIAAELGKEWRQMSKEDQLKFTEI